MKAFGASDIGLRRKQNQDSYVIVESDEGSLLAVVCDGIAVDWQAMSHPIWQSPT